MFESISTFFWSSILFVCFQVTQHEHSHSHTNCPLPPLQTLAWPANAQPRITFRVPTDLSAKTNRNLLMQYRHDWQDWHNWHDGAVRLPTKSTPQHFPHIMRYRRGGQQSNINKCRRAQGQAPSFDHFTIPRAWLQTTQAVERGSHLSQTAPIWIAS